MMLYICCSPYFTYMTGAPASRHTQWTLLWRLYVLERWVMSWIHCFPSLLLSSPSPEWFSVSWGKWCIDALKQLQTTGNQRVLKRKKSAAKPEKPLKKWTLGFQLFFAKIFHLSITGCHALLQTSTAVCPDKSSLHPSWALNSVSQWQTTRRPT